MNLWLTLAVCLGSFGWLFSASADTESRPAPDRYTEAAGAYRSGDLDAAIALWDGLLKDGYRSASVYYNLGNAYYRSGDQPASILSYQRARFLSPNDPDVAANLTKVVRDSGAAVAPRPGWHWTLLGLPAGALTLVAVVSVWSVFLCLVASIWLPSRRDGFRSFAGVWGFVAVLCLAALLGRLHAYNAEQVVILKNGVPAQFQPIEDGTEHFTLQAGSTAWLKESRDSWWLIQSGEQSGWIPSEACARINP